MTISRITKAVVPVAGRGTRLRPLTNVIPKEMLPLGRRPALEYILEELHSVGVNCIIFVVSPTKSAIREHFGDHAFDGQVDLKYVVQNEQHGLADAILHGEELVAGDDFIVALGDTVILSRRPENPLKRLLSARRASNASTGMLVERVPEKDTFMYGIVKPAGSAAGEAFEIDGLVEKPSLGTAPSDFAIGGRYVFESGIFDWIRRTPPGVGGELQITDSIRLAMEAGGRVCCVPVLEGESRFDIGNFKIFCEAFTTVCMQDEELSPSVVKAVNSGLNGLRID